VIPLADRQKAHKIELLTDLVIELAGWEPQPSPRWGLTGDQVAEVHDEIADQLREWYFGLSASLPPTTFFEEQ